MTTTSKYVKTIQGKGKLYTDELSKVPVIYKIDVYAEIYLSGRDSITGRHDLEFTIQIADLETRFSELLPFLNGGIATLELNDGNSLRIIPTSIGFVNPILGKLAAGNIEENLKKLNL